MSMISVFAPVPTSSIDRDESKFTESPAPAAPPIPSDKMDAVLENANAGTDTVEFPVQSGIETEADSTFEA